MFAAEAIRVNDIKSLQHHIDREGFVINAGSGSWTLLHTAVYYRQIECVRLLLDNKANINIDSPSTPLIINYALDDDIAFLLIERGANVFDYRVASMYRESFQRFRRQLAACQLARCALLRVLQGKVHRDVLPMIGQLVWKTRKNEDWDIGSL